MTVYKCTHNHIILTAMLMKEFVTTVNTQPKVVIAITVQMDSDLNP